MLTSLLSVAVNMSVLYGKWYNSKRGYWGWSVSEITLGQARRLGEQVRSLNWEVANVGLNPADKEGTWLYISFILGECFHHQATRYEDHYLPIWEFCEPSQNICFWIKWDASFNIFFSICWGKKPKIITSDLICIFMHGWVSFWLLAHWVNKKMFICIALLTIS